MRKRGGRREEGREGGFGTDLLDQWDHFSKSVVLYMLVFLKLH